MGSVMGRLDALNFFLADVRGGLGSYVSVFLLTEAHWTAAQIGAVLTVSGLLGIILHTPIGALIDFTRAKRALLVIAVALLAFCAIAIERMPTGPVVLAADITMAVLGAIFAPTVAAITLGLVGPQRFPKRVGRNAAFDRLGNVFIAGLVGVVGWWFSQRAVFYLVPFFAVLSALVVLSIPPSAIDHEVARGFSAHRKPGATPESWWSLIVHRKGLMVLAGTAALYHFAGASMLPLAGQKLALAHPGLETVLLSSCILVSQLATIPVAFIVGAKADVWGRKLLLAVACAALAGRGVIFATAESAPILIAAQLFDGIAGGIIDILIPLMLADIVHGSGRYSVSRGIVGTVQGVGGSISQLAGGALVVFAGYSFAFSVLALAAGCALCLVVFGLSDTGRPRPSRQKAHAT
jgi:predicted MFS family arabinose efflux permease